ncbi:glycoside hydrolase family 38 N-terminal domain-containing protein [Paenilisteria rocourtiae]|uniref:Mannosylglycerate hydrolase n=1 Tax=Listeria rocourtiae TaxID=647910 RepID=A0A4R6ZGX5_9LIST|nr:glycoside hydrolase family 38 C-terminal domain-containing protein [Listeria rocourtiae]EUJ44799.1 alpha-mannosidase [Listeria rocourtiae FSL F6-920]TDR51194.1 mannosylglycerate hydrolase [Listeria rocourtiae]
MKYKVHVVPHFHWDREWYFTQEYSDLLLLTDFEEVLDRLENDANYPYFVLDGQTSILEDYCRLAPHNVERIHKLVQSGKLIIGPWYSQTDEMVVGGESIVRNLLYGMEEAERFGEPMKIGYLPDSFGQSAQLPHILNGFGIKHAIFWRGISERFGTDKTEFYWRSKDGSQVLTLLLPLGYAIGKYLPEEANALRERMDKYLPVLKKGATGRHLMLPHGHDQMPLQKNIHTVMEKLHKLYPEHRFEMTSYDAYFKELEATDYPFDVVEGEFLDGKYMRVHRSIYGTRMDIKSLNTRTEQLLGNLVEPIHTMLYMLGGTYYQEYIRDAWKLILLNHAHDSMACCCSDDVHRLIRDRFFKAHVKGTELLNYSMRRIADSVAGSDELVTVFNALTEAREQQFTVEVITKMENFALLDGTREVAFDVIEKVEYDPGLVDRQIVHYGGYNPFYKYTIHMHDSVVAFGYQTYVLKQKDGFAEVVQNAVQEIDTEYYHIAVLENGQLQVTDKRTGMVHAQVLRLESQSDVGDSYDYSPLKNDVIFTNDTARAETSIAETRCGFTATIDYSLALPKTIDERIAGTCGTELGVQLIVEVAKDSPVIQVQALLENNSENHRVRFHIPTAMKQEAIVADNQFGIIERDIKDDAVDYWEKEGWAERPDAIYPFLTFLHAKGGDRSAFVFTKSTREYEVLADGSTIALTAFRSIGLLGEKELVRRPGRPSGIALPTPDSQMLGVIELDFAFGFTTLLDTNSVSRMAKRYVTPLVSYNRNGYNAMKLNDTDYKAEPKMSFISEGANHTATLSIVKKAEKSEAIIVRTFPADDYGAVTDLALNPGFLQGGQLVSLDEQGAEIPLMTLLNYLNKVNESSSFLVKRK